MAKNPGIIPTWAESLGAMLDEGNVEISTICTVCRRHKIIDIATLAEKVGRDYSLLNRRTRCRLKPDCKGWNRFYYCTKNGTWTRPMWTQAQGDKWFASG